MAINLKLATPPSDRELLQLSTRNPGYQFERRAAGDLVVTPTGSASGRRELEVAAQLHRWAAQDGRGLAFGPSTGFHLPDGSVLSPDASWVRRDRWDALTLEQQEAFAPLCPDAIFEIASQSDALQELRAKIRTYLQNGARLAVLIDPQGRTVEIHEQDRPAQIVTGARTVALDPVLPGFTLDLEPVFA